MRGTIAILAFVATSASSKWVELGPFNIFDAVDGHGQTGTCADAASPAGSPETTYLGGSNNAAASGVWKTIDSGETWLPKSNGLTDTRIWSRFIDPSNDAHVFTGTPAGVFHSNDASESWAEGATPNIRWKSA
jgi:hypothetical protein